jgi:hypothetical protein
VLRCFLAARSIGADFFNQPIFSNKDCAMKRFTYAKATAQSLAAPWNRSDQFEGLISPRVKGGAATRRNVLPQLPQNFAPSSLLSLLAIGKRPLSPAPLFAQAIIVTICNIFA